LVSSVKKGSQATSKAQAQLLVLERKGTSLREKNSDGPSVGQGLNSDWPNVGQVLNSDWTTVDRVLILGPITVM